MRHEMKLRHEPFLKIKNGTKTVELRLLDEKRASLRKGDTILFYDTGSGETLECLVTDLFGYPSFEELYRHHDTRSLGYGEDEPADPKDMLAYYTEEEIRRYGVVGIGIECL